MMIGIEDNSKSNVAFNLEALLAVAPDGPEHSNLYMAHMSGLPIRIHLTPAEFMSRIGAAMEQMQGRAALLGLMKPPGVKQ